MLAARAAALPPSAALPRLRSQPDAARLEEVLGYLECLYAPSLTLSMDESLDPMRADVTERQYAMNWLARIVGEGAAWVVDGEQERAILERSAAILTASSSGLDTAELVREFAFPLGATPTLKLTVRDAPLPPSSIESVHGAAEAAAAVGMQTYGSSVIMSDWLVRNRSFFHASPEVVSPFTVVELGAGTGIVGMVAASVFSSTLHPTNVYITDYHASVMKNLQHNVDAYLNAASGECEHVKVVCEPLDWRALHMLLHPGDDAGVACRIPPPQSASLLLAADVVYDPRHATWVLSAIAHLLRQPDTDPDARAHILVPIRNAGRLAGLHATIDTAIAACQAAPRHGYLSAAAWDATTRVDIYGLW
ncbi:hypothetical protein MVES_000375 [Malassezia vespertilionis]|uniref:S-adenosylmethionine-dependent methyltransferase n=1 Tax=Malassezia vespertilionis TaxID=2020962 RepID=A0A2N1JHC9_9BASI|nr:hypothetical protein MVES_000375 [Malassezia vespertilionis]